MKTTRRKVLFLMPIALMTSATISASDDETAFSEGLHDLAALVRSGINYKNYMAKLDEVIVLADRYTRRGGTSAVRAN